MIEKNFINYAINFDIASAERMNGEYMLINFESGNYFSVCDVGADIVSLISARVDRGSWENILSREWKIEPSMKLTDEINRFLKVLKDYKLIYEIDNFKVVEIRLPSDLDRTVYKFSPLSTYEDMSDLLMVDPIHDTSLKGWPNREIQQ